MPCILEGRFSLIQIFSSFVARIVGYIHLVQIINGKIFILLHRCHWIIDSIGVYFTILGLPISHWLERSGDGRFKCLLIQRQNAGFATADGFYSGRRCWHQNDAHTIHIRRIYGDFFSRSFRTHKKDKRNGAIRFSMNRRKCMSLNEWQSQHVVVVRCIYTGHAALRRTQYIRP